MKQVISILVNGFGLVAPRTGAWIETRSPFVYLPFILVAPRTGAWIETWLSKYIISLSQVAPRTGAWIETKTKGVVTRSIYPSLPARERGLKLDARERFVPYIESLPARERGLKHLGVVGVDDREGRSPHGSVD